MLKRKDEGEVIKTRDESLQKGKHIQMAREKGEKALKKNRTEREIVVVGVKLIEGGTETKKRSETVKYRENRAMNYSVIILSDSSPRRLFSCFCKKVFF